MTSERIRKRAVASAFLSPLYRRSGCVAHSFRHATALLAAARLSIHRNLHSSSRAVRIWETGFHLCLWLPCFGSEDRCLSCPALAAVRRRPSRAARARWISLPFSLTVGALVMALSPADGGLGPNSLRCACVPLAFHTSSRVRLMWRVTLSDSILRACSSATVSAYVAIGSTSASVASRALGVRL